MQSNSSVHTLSYRVALGGILASLCLMCMFLTGMFPIFYIMLPMVASALIYVMVIETTLKWGFFTFLAVGVLSLIVTPNKDSALIFLIFFGYYPILRAAMNRWRVKVVSFILRLAIFNAAVLIYFYGSVYLLGATELLESLGDYGKYGGWVLLGLCNVIFICFDYIMSLFPEVYRKQLKSRISPSKMTTQPQKKSN